MLGDTTLGKIIAWMIVLALIALPVWIIVAVIRNEPNREADYVANCMTETGWPQRTCEWVLNNNRQ